MYQALSNQRNFTRRHEKIKSKIAVNLRLNR
jgi:hypothetical protein